MNEAEFNQADATAVALVTAFIAEDDDLANNLLIELAHDELAAGVALDRLASACKCLAVALATLLSMNGSRRIGPEDAWAKYALIVASNRPPEETP